MCAEVGQKESSFASLGDSGYLHLVYRHLLSAQQLSDSSSPKQHCKCSFSGADGQKIHSHCNRLAHTFWFNSITFRLFSAFVSGIQRKVCPGFDPDSWSDTKVEGQAGWGARNSGQSVGHKLQRWLLSADRPWFWDQLKAEWPFVSHTAVIVVVGRRLDLFQKSWSRAALTPMQWVCSDFCEHKRCLWTSTSPFLRTSPLFSLCFAGDAVSWLVSLQLQGVTKLCCFRCEIKWRNLKLSSISWRREETKKLEVPCKSWKFSCTIGKKKKPKQKVPWQTKTTFWRPNRRNWINWRSSSPL